MRVLYLSSSPHVDTKLPAGVSVLHPGNPTLWSSEKTTGAIYKNQERSFRALVLGGLSLRPSGARREQ